MGNQASTAQKTSRQTELEQLNRQQLQELEEKEKTPFQKFLDCVIVLFPILCGAIAVAEYLLVPNSSNNSNPNTYLYLLVILIVLYTVRAIVALVKYAMNDKPFFQKVRYKAPLHAAFFLLLTAYDYLTLKTGILYQPFVPCLNSIINIAWEDREMLIVSTLHTLRLLFLGYFIGVILGLITGITCGYSRKVRYWIDPLIKFLGPIPTSTWIPIIMVLVSSLFKGSVFIIALGVWFALTIASSTGIQNVDKAYLEAARTLGAKGHQLVFRVAIPHAMPNILQGMTQGMSSACTALLVAEMMGAEAGLGWYIQWQKSWAIYSKMYAAIVLICLIFTAVTFILNVIKRIVLRWQEGVVK